MSISSWLSIQWERIVDVPRDSYSDPVTYFRVRTLRILTASALVMVALGLLKQMVQLGPGFWRHSGAQASVAFVAIALLIFRLAARGRMSLAIVSWALWPPILVAGLVSALRGTGVANPGMDAFFLVIMVSALLAGRAATLASAAAALAATLIVGWASAHNLIGRPLNLSAVDLSDTVESRANTVVFIALLLLLWENLHQRLLEAAVANARAEKKALEHARLEREGAEKQDQFVRLISHELKSPLTSIKTYTQVLRRRLEIEHPQAADNAARMERPIRRMEMLLNDLVDMARLEAGRLEPDRKRCDLKDPCYHAADEAEVTHEREVRPELPAAPVFVQADPERIGQVLSNLLANACKYSPAGSPVTLSLSVQGHEAVVEVRDRGPGIAPEHRERIFERFYRVPGAHDQSSAGTNLGLGLYLCRRLIEAHGGRIWVESEVGRGSSFFFALPLAAETDGQHLPERLLSL